MSGPRTSTAGPACRRRSAARARRPTASPSWAPPSGSPPSSRSTPTATATRSWCSTATTSTRSAAGVTRSSSTCATGCWSRPHRTTPSCWSAGRRSSPGAQTEYYDRVHLLDYWVQDGILLSSRSVSSYARGNMMRLSPRAYVADAWTWTLGADGALRHGEPECLVQSFDSTRACGLDQQDTLAHVPPERAAYVEPGGILDTRDETGYGFTARIDVRPRSSTDSASTSSRRSTSPTRCSAASHRPRCSPTARRWSSPRPPTVARAGADPGRRPHGRDGAGG